MEDSVIRVQKFISHAGVCSRRKAEQHISDGEVTINGVIAELGDSVEPGKDQVRLNGRLITIPKVREFTTLMMNKPKGVICSNDDPHNPNTIFDLLPKQYAKDRLFCAGRLDKDSEGLIILTNDGDLSHKITHPSKKILKKYKVTIQKDLREEMIPKLLQGREIEGDYLKFEKVIIGGVGVNEGKILEIHLHHGKKREIRRLLESYGFYVKKLKRYQIGALILKKVPLGGVRALNKKEIDLLFS
jgi:23S rRNA pseudouridine2605 synthase